MGDDAVFDDDGAFPLLEGAFESVMLIDMVDYPPMYLIVSCHKCKEVKKERKDHVNRTTESASLSFTPSTSTSNSTTMSHSHPHPHQHAQAAAAPGPANAPAPIPDELITLHQVGTTY